MAGGKALHMTAVEISPENWAGRQLSLLWLSIAATRMTLRAGASERLLSPIALDFTYLIFALSVFGSEFAILRIAARRFSDALESSPLPTAFDSTQSVLRRIRNLRLLAILMVFCLAFGL